jgi:enoyl-CoA hydratase/carnithine racemase
MRRPFPADETHNGALSQSHHSHYHNPKSSLVKKMALRARSSLAGPLSRRAVALACSSSSPVVLRSAVRAAGTAAPRAASLSFGSPPARSASTHGSAPAPTLAELANTSEMIKIEKRDDRVVVITLHRPRALNALCDQLMGELNQALSVADLDPEVGCVVLTGSEKAFAAGADIKEMAGRSFMECYNGNMFTSWADVAKRRKPIIAAVNGYALGGGCELAMMCDLIVAGDRAKFGQPEITLGTIPGGGGTQRLVKAVGKSLAMDMCLTGDMINAQRALDAGLVAHVVPADELVDFALAKAAKIASFSQPIINMTKEAINRSFETPLEEGLLAERRNFHSTFATKDQKEGMAAFAEKRKPDWSHE